MTKRAGSGSASGSVSQRHGSADPDPDPDPHQYVMDPQHWLYQNFRVNTWIYRFHRFCLWEMFSRIKISVRIRIRNGSEFNQVSGSGFRIHKNRKKLENLMCWSAGCSLCSLDVIYCNFLDQLKNINFFFSCTLFSIFFHQFKFLDPVQDWHSAYNAGSWSGSGIN